MTKKRRAEVREALREDWKKVYAIPTQEEAEEYDFRSFAVGFALAKGYTVEEAEYFYMDMIDEGIF